MNLLHYVGGEGEGEDEDPRTSSALSALQPK